MDAMAMGMRPAYHDVLEVVTDMLAQFRMISGDRKGVVIGFEFGFWDREEDAGWN